MATEGLAEHAGLIGAIICWTAVLHRHLERAQRYIAETTTFCAHHDLGMFQPIFIAAEGLVRLHQGDWDRAAALAEDVLTRPRARPTASDSAADHRSADPGPPRAAIRGPAAR